MIANAETKVATTLTFGTKGGENTLKVPLGSQLIIRAETNPSTGYNWNLVGSAPSCLELISTDYERQMSKSGKQLIGAPSVLTLRFRAVSKCTLGDLQYIYSRSWEPIEGNEPSITVHVAVTDQNEL